LSAHLLAIFRRDGIDAATVVTVGALFGPAQVCARLVEHAFARRGRNYNAMNQWFLAFVVKAHAAIFTIPMRFAGLLRRAITTKMLMLQAFAARIDVSVKRIRVNHGACVPPFSRLPLCRAGERLGLRRSPLA
jgi:hypothetical protein